MVQVLPDRRERASAVGRWCIETAGGKIDDSLDLLAVKSIEPFHDVVDARSRS